MTKIVGLSLMDEENKNGKELNYTRQRGLELSCRKQLHSTIQENANIDTIHFQRKRAKVANNRALTQQASASTCAATVFYPSTPDSFSGVEKETFLKDPDASLVKELFPKICEPEVYPNFMADVSIWEEALFMQKCIDTAES